MYEPRWCECVCCCDVPYRIAAICAAILHAHCNTANDERPRGQTASYSHLAMQRVMQLKLHGNLRTPQYMSAQTRMSTYKRIANIAARLRCAYKWLNFCCLKSVPVRQRTGTGRGPDFRQGFFFNGIQVSGYEYGGNELCRSIY